ncbi:MAG: WYL domain-containing protein, partial [Acidimicrobiia bacterium]|nr:WYL domain-containing protein [Acidimicrobiia bacterium]
HGEVVKLVGPPSVRDQLAGRLEAILESLAHKPEVPAELTSAFGEAAPEDGGTPERQVARADRLLRLIGLAGRREYTNAELSEILEVSDDELADDLAQLTYYCGLPPLYGGDTVDAIPFAGRVRVRGPALPLVEQLTGREVSALAIALRTALADSALEAGAKAVLASALRVICPESGSMAVDSPATEREGATILAAITAGVRDMRSIDITHWSPQTGTRKQRRVDPWRLGEVRGRTYLIGWDHASRERRVFRTDRIEAVVLADEAFTRPEDDTTDFGGTGYVLSPDDIYVYVRLPAGHADWARARYGDGSLAEIEGMHVLRLPTSDLERLAPLLVSLMPAAEIIAPSEARTAVATFARRLLTDLRVGWENTAT